MRPAFTAFLLTGALAVSPAFAQQAGPTAGQDSAAYFFLLGRHLEGEGRIDEAVVAHKRAIELSPDSAELHAELAGLYARQDKAVEAVEFAEAALQRDPANHEANRILGSVYAAFAAEQRPLRPGEDPSQYAARAVAALEKARAPTTFDVGLELTLGRLYLQTGAYDKAVPILQRVVTDQPGYAEGAVLLSAAQEAAGNPDEAILTLERLLADNPAFFRGQLRIAELYEHQQRWKEAAEAYGRAQALNARAPMLTGRRAVALLNSGQAAAAVDLLQSSLSGERPDAQEPALLYVLAEAQRRVENLEEAQNTAQKLLAAHPADVRGLHVLSHILQDKKDFAGAERILRELIAKDPLDANALNSLGYMFAERGERLDEAVELLKRALQIEPDNGAFLDSLGWAYFQQGRLDLADAPLAEAAAKLTMNSVVQDHLGDLRFRQNRFAEAAEAWERALAGDGQSIDRAKIEQKIRDARARLGKR